MDEAIFGLLTKFGSAGIIIAFLFYGLRYFIQKNEELFKALNESHTTTNDKYIQLINKQAEDHAKCSENYILLSGKLEEVVRNNTEAIKEIREYVEQQK